MPIIDAKVLRTQFGDQLHVLLDKIPDMSKLRYQHKLWHGRGLWWGEADGMVQFYAWTGPGNEHGFGGSVIPIVTTEGEHVSLLGPWSSRPGVMNKAGFPACMDVKWTVSRGDFEQNQGRYGCILVSKVNFAGKITLVRQVDHDGEPTWEPVT